MLCRNRWLAVALLLLPGVADGGGSEGVRLGLHIADTERLARDPNVRHSLPVGCDYPHGSRLRVHGEIGVEYLVYVVVLDLDPEIGFAAVLFHVDYEAEDLVVSAGRALTGFQISDPDFPAPGTRTLLRWIDPEWKCRNRGYVDPADPQGEAMYVVQVFAVRALRDATFRLTGRWGYGAKIVDCQSRETTFTDTERLGALGFGSAFASDPCARVAPRSVIPIPVRPTTWGRVKRMYASP